MSYETKDLNTIISDLIINVVDNVDEVTDANVGGVMRQMLESIGIEVRDLYTQLDELYAGTRIDTATGDDLDELGKLLGITRKTGTNSMGDVTFIRNAPAVSNFTIAGGLVVSTQPNTGDEQFRFVTSSNVTFYTTLTDELHTFEEGIYNYKLDERFIGNTTTTIVTGLISASSVTFVNSSDYNIIKGFSDIVENPDTVTMLDNCDAADWTEADAAGAVDIDSSDKREGVNSLKLSKPGFSTEYATYYKVLGGTVNIGLYDLLVDLKIEDAATLAMIDEIQLWVGSGGSVANSYMFSIDATNLSVGWDVYKVVIRDSTTIRTGSPNLSAVNYLKIKVVTKNAADTFTTGKVKMDFWHAAETEDYEGDVVQWADTGNKPDTTTDFAVTYTPLSKEVPTVAETIGENYNVSKKKIIYQVSSIPNINSVSNYNAMTGGTDLETDTDLRERILFATELKGKATVESIRQAILAVNGVSSVSIDDTPKVNFTSEVHLYSSSTDVYKLNTEVLYLDSTTSPTNITVVGTVSATSNTFSYGTDYKARYGTYGEITSEIEWQNAGTKPDDATIFFVDYTADWLGHATAFVSGTESPIPATVITDINTAIYDSRAAGIVVTLTEPTTVYTAVTAQILADTVNGYTFIAIKDAIETALIVHLNGLDVGETVYRAKLFEVIMAVTGVKNCTITVPATDGVIGTNEICKAGTITLTSL